MMSESEQGDNNAKEVLTVDFCHVQYDPDVLRVEKTNSYVTLFMGDKLVAVVFVNKQWTLDYIKFHFPQLRIEA